MRRWMTLLLCFCLTAVFARAQAAEDRALSYVRSLDRTGEWAEMSFELEAAQGNCPVREILCVAGKGPIPDAQTAETAAREWMEELCPGIGEELKLDIQTDFRVYYDDEYRVWLVRLEWLDGHENAFLMKPVYFWFTAAEGEMIYFEI